MSAAITKIHGKHEISFGFEWMKRYLNVGQPPRPAGCVRLRHQRYGSVHRESVRRQRFRLVPHRHGNDRPAPNPNLANPNFTKDIFAAESSPYYAAFVEDTFHASKTLTITAGLRWDIFGGRNERFNRLEYFDPSVTNTVNGNSYTGAEIYVNGSNRSPFTTNLHDFGPRLGFAWQPVQHFVVRGGAGFYYGPSHTTSPARRTTPMDSLPDAHGSPLALTNGDGNTVFNGTSCGTHTGSRTGRF